MLKHVFLSLLVILGNRDLNRLNLINHLLKSDLGGKTLKLLSCQFLLMPDSSLLWVSLF